jgi:hypothetical protein
MSAAKQLTRALPAVLLLLAAACGGPSPSVVEEALRSHLDDGNSTRVKIAKFTKTSGADRDFMGEKVHEMGVEAILEFTEDAHYTTGRSGPNGVFYMGTLPATYVNPPCKSMFGRCEPGPTKAAKGDRLHMTGKALFAKSEKGWSLVSVEYEPPTKG